MNLIAVNDVGKSSQWIVYAKCIQKNEKKEKEILRKFIEVLENWLIYIYGIHFNNFYVKVNFYFFLEILHTPMQITFRHL